MSGRAMGWYPRFPARELSAAQCQRLNFADSDPLAYSLSFEARPDVAYKYDIYASFHVLQKSAFKALFIFKVKQKPSVS